MVKTNLNQENEVTMRTFIEIKKDYRFTQEDEHRLAELRSIMEEHAEEIMTNVNHWIMESKGASAFFTEA